MLTITPDQIPYDIAYNAHRGTSMTPDIRARQVQNNYVKMFRELVTEFENYEMTEQTRVQMWKALEAYRTAYVIKYLDMLRTQSNCLSPMIAGPSNFPTQRAKKANNAYDNKVKKFIDWSNATLKRLRNEFDPARIAARPIETGEHDSIERAQSRLDEAIALQAKMKAANKICRSKKLANGEKIEALIALGFSRTQSTELLVYDFTGKVGFAPYQLTNNNATIRRYKQRIIELTAENERREQPAQDLNVGPVTMTENVDQNRLQIIFPNKPNDKTRTWLKSRGFRWAPSQNAWQRKLTQNARAAGKSFMTLLANGDFDE